MPRELTSEQEQVLLDLAHIVVDELELRLASRKALEEVQERERAEKEARQQSEYLAALHETTLGLMERMDVDELLEAIVSRAGALVGTRHGFVRLYDPQLDAMVMKVGIGACSKVMRIPLQRGEGVAGQVLQSGQPVVVDDFHAWEGGVRAPEFEPFRALVGVPLKSGRKVVGMIGLVHLDPERKFGASEIVLLERFARLATLALDNAQLYSSAQREIVERKRAEQELQRHNVELEQLLEKLAATRDQLVTQEKLASLGALTAGIAHEIKNPLNFVKNFAELSIELMDDVLEEYEKQADRLGEVHRRTIRLLMEDLRENLEKVLKHGGRADAIVHGMLLHSRGGSGKRQPTDLNRLLRDYVGLAYHGMRANDSRFVADVETEYDRNVGQVDIVPQEIGRAFLNILHNALQAIREKALAAGEDYAPTLRVTTRRLENAVEVRIRDNGVGITPDAEGRIFEPFFTTKSANEGTGLGLSISHDIITQQHQGELSVKSAPGRFTEVVIRLP